MICLQLKVLFIPRKHIFNLHDFRQNDNLRSQDAINVTFFHWGLHAWIVYTIIALLLAFLGYRKGLPMTMRTCFQPLLGDKVFGFLGDAIDILSVVATMFGVCTSLGLGVIQLNTGINRINRNIQISIKNQIIIIWGVTAIATMSVVSGVKLGIRRLSEICFAVGKDHYMFRIFREFTLLSIFDLEATPKRDSLPWL